MTWYRAILSIDPFGSLKPFWYDFGKTIYRSLFDGEFRRYLWLLFRYGRTRRYTGVTITVHGWTLNVPDIASFLSAYREIFVEEIYAFNSTNEKPVVLDCGANIGLSILYFKMRYPEASVVAYEADPFIFEVLKKNLTINNVSGVELHNEAIWSTQTMLDFSVEGADGGRINVGKDKNIITVRSARLADVLARQKFDFIKLDIEGAEVEALIGCEPYLARSTYFFVEFHSFQHRPQQLGWLIDIFERAGFRVHIHPPFIAKRPFLGISAVGGMDMQLNLFFWKDSHANA